MQQAPDISIISPVYNSAGIIPELVRRLHAALYTSVDSYEIILVDDASTDESAEVIKNIAALDSRIKGVYHTRNIGQHPSILHGLTVGSSAMFVVMDCDLQDPPEAIGEMIAACADDIEAVFAMRKKTYNSRSQQFLSRMFYGCISLISGKSFSHEIANFGLYRKHIIEEVLRKKYRYFLFPLAVRQVTKKSTTIDVEHALRFEGKSSYTIFKAVGLAMKAILGNSVFGFIFKKHSVDALISRGKSA